MQVDLAAVRSASAAYPKPAEFRPSYGTAGFRAEASLLPSTVFRCGMLIGLKANATGQVGGECLLQGLAWDAVSYHKRLYTKLGNRLRQANMAP